MSAFGCCENHINALVTVCLEGPADAENPGAWYAERSDGTAIARMLVLENARSIAYRYRESVATPVIEYRESERRPTIVEALKAIACFEYQACEHPEWTSSEAYRWCQALRERLCTQLAGWEKASGWQWRHR